MAVTGRVGDKTKSLGLNWPHAEETRRIHSQEDHRVEETPAHLEAHKNGSVGGETTDVRNLKRTAQNRFRWRHEWTTSVPPGTKRIE